MKPTFFICSVIGILICLNSCQTKQSDGQESSKTIEQIDFDGIYEFKIGKTTSNALDTLDYEFREMSVKEDIDQEIKRNGIESVENWELLCKGVRIYKIEDFQKKNMEFSDFELTFVNDTLCEISCSTSSEFEETLLAKYPNYTFDDTTSTKIRSYRWINGSIRASSILSLDSYGFIFYITDFDRAEVYNYSECERVKNEYLAKINSDL